MAISNYGDLLDKVQQRTLDDIVNLLETSKQIHALTNDASVGDAIQLLLAIIQTGSRIRAAILNQLGIPVTDITSTEQAQAAAPFGYKEVNGAKAPIALEEQVIAYARDLAIGGIKPKAIAEQLKLDGFTSYGGRRYSEAQIQAMLEPAERERVAQSFGGANGAGEKCLRSGCVAESRTRGLCSSHYQAESARVARGQTSWEALESEGLARGVTGPPPCLHQPCPRLSFSRGLCPSHYQSTAVRVRHGLESWENLIAIGQARSATKPGRPPKPQVPGTRG